VDRIFDFMILIISYIFKVTFIIIEFFGKNITSHDLLCFSVYSDGKVFWNLAIETFVTGVKTTHNNFPNILALIFKITGINIIPLMMINILLYHLFLITLIQIFYYLKIESSNYQCPLLIATFMIYGNFLTLELLREAYYFFFISWSFYYMTRYIYERKLSQFIAAIIITLPVLYLHDGYFIIPVVYLWHYIIINNHKKNIQFIFDIVTLLFAVIFAISAKEIILGYVFNRLNDKNIIETLITMANDRTVRSGSEYLMWYKTNNIPELFVYMILKTFYYLFSPLPLEWRGIADVGAFIFDSCLQILFFISLFKAKTILKANDYIENNAKTIIVNMVGLIVILLAVVFGMGTMSAGTAMRHRDPIISMELVVVAIYIDSKRKKLLNNSYCEVRKNVENTNR